MNTRSHVCIFLSIQCFLCLGGEAHAALDPGLNTPYPVKIVLSIADHRMLTPLFREQLEEELPALVRQTFGQLVEVEVLRGHPWLKDIRAKGLTALDGFDELTGQKTHFILIDFVQGHYEIHARQHDGVTGQASAVVRREVTSDRRQVARVAAQLIEKDFGLIGTVTKVEGAKVQLTLQGGGLGVPLERWLHPGDIFAISRVIREGGTERAAKLDFSLLQVTDKPQKGVCHCRAYVRYREDELRPGGDYRCMQITAIRGPVKLRVVDEKTKDFLGGVQVFVAGTFEDKGLGRATGPDGLRVTPESFDRIAFVRVVSGGSTRAHFPVAIVDDRTIVCPISVSAEAEAQGQLVLRRDAWIRRCYEALLVADHRVTDLNAALARSPQEALELAKGGIKNLSAELENLANESAELRKLAPKSPGGLLDLSEGDQRLVELTRRRAELEQFAGGLTAAIEKENSPRTRELRAKVERGRLLESQAEFAQALALYEEVLKEEAGEKILAAHYETLKKAWLPSEMKPDHVQAREFIYTTWPRLDLAGLKTQLAQAEKALKTCQDRGDKLSPVKLLHANVSHAANLKKRLEALRRATDSEQAREETKSLLATSEQLQGLHAQATAWIRKKGD